MRGVDAGESGGLRRGRGEETITAEQFCERDRSEGRGALGKKMTADVIPFFRAA
jgi:hypothetical protein